jgi:hypothetical protein
VAAELAAVLPSTPSPAGNSADAQLAQLAQLQLELQHTRAAMAQAEARHMDAVSELSAAIAAAEHQRAKVCVCVFWCVFFFLFLSFLGQRTLTRISAGDGQGR